MSLWSAKTAGISGHNPTTQSRILYFDLVRFCGACQPAMEHTQTGRVFGEQASWASLVNAQVSRGGKRMDLVRLQFLSSGDAFGSSGRLQTCFLLAEMSDSVLIDCGTSSLIAMKRSGIDASRIAGSFSTTCTATISLRFLDGQFNRRMPPFVIAGPPRALDRVESEMEVLFPGSSRVSRRREFIELGDCAASQSGRPHYNSIPRRACSSDAISQRIR